MTAVEILGGVASVASFAFLLLGVIGQFRWEIKGKSYRTHVQVAGAITGAILLFSLIFIDWGIGFGVFYSVVEAIQIASIIRAKKLREEASKKEASFFEAGKAAGKVEAEALLASQLAAVEAKGKAEAKAEAEADIRDLKIALAEEKAKNKIYESKLS